MSKHFKNRAELEKYIDKVLGDIDKKNAARLGIDLTEESKKSEKPDCYTCKYRGSVPGDAHSRCDHPKVSQGSNSFGALVDMLSGKNNSAAWELKIQGNPTGIKNGWFMWPANFDPIWLENCEGWEERKK